MKERRLDAATKLGGKAVCIVTPGELMQDKPGSMHTENDGQTVCLEA